MLDDEEANEQPGCGDCQQERQPIPAIGGHRHDHEQRDEWRRRRDHLKQASLQIRAIGLESRRQALPHNLGLRWKRLVLGAFRSEIARFMVLCG